MSENLIREIEDFVNRNSPLNISGKIQYHDWEEDNQTAFIELIESDNPAKDEVSHFVLACDDFGDLQCFDGEPKFMNGKYINCL